LVVTVRPQFWVRGSLVGLAGAVIAASLMAFLAAVVPTRRISRLDPASVYRG
jgi:ABC-type lipoprotein release transport system permease subunit